MRAMMAASKFHEESSFSVTWMKADGKIYAEFGGFLVRVILNGVISFDL